MRLVVFGANGPTGRQVVQQALAAGHQVVAVARNPDDYPFRSPDLDVVLADVTDRDAVRRAMTGTDAVISTYGVPYSRKRITVYSNGIANIVAAMTTSGITRLVCVTSTTVATERAPGESVIGRTILLPFLRRVIGRTLYNDMEHMEDIVRASSVEWTIVRPGGLFDAAHPTEDYDVSVQRLSGHLTSRADLAETLLREATTRQHVGAVIEVVSRSGLPGAGSFLRGAFGPRR